MYNRFPDRIHGRGPEREEFLLVLEGTMRFPHADKELAVDEVLGKRVTIAGWPIRWVKGDGSIVRLVAIVDEGDQ